jgi:hypothetical protein
MNGSGLRAFFFWCIYLNHLRHVSLIMSHLIRKAISSLKQGGTLSILSRAPKTCLVVTPEWRDDGSISYDPAKLYVQIIPQADKVTSLGRSESHVVVQVDSQTDGSIEEALIEAIVPEKINLSCRLCNGGNIQITNKIEGDTELMTSDGYLKVKKLRGYRISLEASGAVHASDLVEAQQIHILASRVRAKRIHGSDVTVQINKLTPDAEDTKLLDDDDEGAAIDISSIYISGNGSATLEAMPTCTSTKSIRCKSHHGHVNAHGNKVVELGGVNGSFDLLSRGSARVHIDSVSPDSISVASAEKEISFTLDRKLEADLRLLVASPDDDDKVHEFARSFLVDDDQETLWQGLQQLDELNAVSKSDKSHSGISVVTSAFAEEVSPSVENISFVRGFVDNQSMEPDSRFEQQVRGAGKIRLHGAAIQALAGFSKVGEKEKVTERPLIVGSSREKITVESLSWLGAIARRYGLEEDENRPSLGRQATRRGREVLPNK